MRWRRLRLTMRPWMSIIALMALVLGFVLLPLRAVAYRVRQDLP